MLLLCANAACGPGLGRTPTETAACRRVAGSWVSSYGNSCGRFSNGDATIVTQTGCTMAVAVRGVGSLTGTIVDDTVSWTVDFGSECKGTGTGVGTVEATRITGTYSGLQAGASCCATAVAGTFTLSAK